MATVNYQTTGEQESDYSPIPAGDYVAHIKDSGLKDAKSGGKYLGLTWEILSPENFKGRLIFENLNLWHDNNQAKEIAQKSMNSICIAAGKPEGVRDSGELHNKAMTLKIAVKTDPQYGDSNVIKKHSAIAGQAPVATAPSGKKPWEK